MNTTVIKISEENVKELNKFLNQEEEGTFPEFSIEEKFQDGYSTKLELVQNQNPHILIKLIDKNNEVVAWSEDTQISGKYQFDTCKFEEEATIYCENNNIDWNDFEKTDKYKELSEKHVGVRL